MKKYVCSICGYIFDEAAGLPEAGIAPGTKWADIPDSFKCPLCGAAKALFKAEESETKEETHADAGEEEKELRKLSAMEMSVLYSNLAKGCEKQYKTEEMELFTKLAEYYKKKVEPAKNSTLPDLERLLDGDVASGFSEAKQTAKQAGDRGALRVLVWSEKASMIMKSLMERYRKEGDALLENTRIYVCDICGFMYVGDVPPEICPVCKVPSFKLLKVERG